MEAIKINNEYLKAYVTPDDLNSIEAEVRQAKQTLTQHQGKGNDFLGWLSLPEETTPEVLNALQAEADRLSAMSEVLVVIGIGGSYLGARAVIEALQSEHAALTKSQHPYVIYAGHTLSEDYYKELLAVLDRKDYSVAVISKSGTTTEPAVAFRIVKQHMMHKYGNDYAQRVVAITDATKGALRTIATQEGYHTYVIPDDVGGRFSVLTPVGLLPIAAAGFDIRRLLQGAQSMQRLCHQADTLADNPAMMYAALRNLLYRKGKKVEVLTNFQPNLRYVSEWWKQLYGESEGKEGKGLLPHSLSFTTDLHSMGQYVQQGERILFETTLTIEQPRHNVSVPHDEQDLDGINYLAGRRLSYVNSKAEQGTLIAHSNGGVPIIDIVLPRIDEETLGQLLYFFEFACGISGYMLGVNPFDQPGVEAYKRNMFTLLGKPGHENRPLE